MAETYPSKIDDVKQLEEILTRPSAELISYIRQLSGDIAVLGAGGKVGPSMVMMAKRAIDEAGVKKRLIAVDVLPLEQLAQQGVETIQCDLLDLQAVKDLPKVENVIFMAGRKFGSTGTEWLTWAVNVMIPHYVADVFRDSRTAVFSTGCVYPPVHVYSGGSVETDSPDPIGEYSVSCLGRERMFDYYAAQKGAQVVQIRLNYALELRYGVLVDIATKVYNGEDVDVTTGFFNGIWQGDVCDQVLRCMHLASSPSAILNITGPEMVSVRWAATRFGEIFGKTPSFVGEENGKGYLSNAAKANSLFGNPRVPIGTIIDWIANWIEIGGANIAKPTHFEIQDGKY